MAEVLPIEPDYVLPTRHTASVAQTTGAGIRQRYKQGIKVEREWDCSWNALSNQERSQLKQHWIDRLGAVRSFTWQPPNVGSVLNVRFKDESFEWQQTAEGYSARVFIVEIV